MKKTAIAALTMFGVIGMLSTQSYAANFSDVKDGSWSQAAIQEMSGRGFIGGYSDGSFQPSKKITRAELVTVINKMNSLTQEAEISFSDVNDSSWAYKEIRKAVSAGYVAGFADGTFKPNETVTREQMAVMLNNLYKLENKNSNININDIEKVSPWAQQSVKNILSYGVMSGYADGNFGSKGEITRAEAVVALHNITKTGISFNSSNMETPSTKPTETLETKPSTNNTGNTTGGGGNSSGGGGGSSSGGITEEQKKINQKLETTVNNLKNIDYSTQNQTKTAEIISESIKKYLNNPSYDISSDVEKAKDLTKQMTESEKEEFIKTTTDEIGLIPLLDLNKKFNLIDTANLGKYNLD
ncbi:S-layer homology domain-containing protein [Acetoanaerobium noterae]|uniref:S-layer homology domain-containing protein n=1 Tax=Acetoanaerobium noterae TaxID=745369 RepID=UPI0028AC2E2E|nr:S-layer homology domain-containing protein [Acetoanaerobium noterae]